MKVFTGTNVDSYFVADLEFRLEVPDSGFSFSFGSGSNVNNFVTGLSFSGSGGYLFDQSGNFFGGYKSGELFEIQVHCFDFERASYFYNKKLMANNVQMNASVNAILFDKYGDSSLKMRISSRAIEEPEATISEDAVLFDSSAIVFDGSTILFS